MTLETFESPLLAGAPVDGERGHHADFVVSGRPRSPFLVNWFPAPARQALPLFVTRRSVKELVTEKYCVNE